MIFVEVKEGETFDRALKRFKKKVERVRVLREARERMYYTKPANRRKAEKLKAIYKYSILNRERV
ncbi:30S ribosomal protein S21 [Candidatus Cardinium hertigii]|uniref:Small ribosomal subunit protein bS21 n=1 Tax=Candidatus Cardinium hertigii TaxID=247481 RepID=A0A3N2QBA2_9BACT|nr:30S ribosomal protein S21 [Candidatus Cardinium hertigii]ROT47087.1 30S ribosomal protein S21 [Candidatus Cardinium hertigii]